jgi:hypothetical protein
LVLVPILCGITKELRKFTENLQKTVEKSVETGYYVK